MSLGDEGVEKETQADFAFMQKKEGFDINSSSQLGPFPGNSWQVFVIPFGWVKKRPPGLLPSPFSD